MLHGSSDFSGRFLAKAKFGFRAFDGFSCFVFVVDGAAVCYTKQLLSVLCGIFGGVLFHQQSSAVDDSIAWKILLEG